MPPRRRSAMLSSNSRYSLYTSFPRLLQSIRRTLQENDPAGNPHDPILCDLPRDRNIFPGGFGKSDQAEVPPNDFSLPQLRDILVNQGAPQQHVEHIFVKSALYCKQKHDPKHEFIILTVETAEDRRFRNFLVLDRTSSIPADRIARQLIGTISSSVQPVLARDRLRVAFDGELKSLIDHCKLSNYDVLEKLQFGKMDFLLYQLVTLAHAASERHKFYRLHSKQCYWYASLVWDCTMRLCPSALHTDAGKKLRGKLGIFRQKTEAKELAMISSDVGKELQVFKEKREKDRKVSEFYTYVTSTPCMLTMCYGAIGIC
ncbi:hypothetical protein FRC10_000365 [Ceratobasidium sp. 414]|nr:hypothetical protein FRC10_000365 [Ceratobasidium sp. 414]